MTLHNYIMPLFVAILIKQLFIDPRQERFLPQRKPTFNTARPQSPPSPPSSDSEDESINDGGFWDRERPLLEFS